MVLPSGKWRRQPQNCCIPNCKEEIFGWTGYIFFADDSAQHAGWCGKHHNEYYEAANPLFENQAALDLFKAKHPKAYEEMQGIGKQIVFLSEVALKENKGMQHE